jgi:hypothetical protein
MFSPGFRFVKGLGSVIWILYQVLDANAYFIAPLTQKWFWWVFFAKPLSGGNILREGHVARVPGTGPGISKMCQYDVLLNREWAFYLIKASTNNSQREPPRIRLLRNNYPTGIADERNRSDVECQTPGRPGARLVGNSSAV